MNIPTKFWRACLIGTTVVVGLRGAELPTPLAAAIDRLRANEAYTWTTETQMQGAPFEVALVKGWVRSGGASWVEAGVGPKSIQVATQGVRRAVKFEGAWTTPSAASSARSENPAELARLLAFSYPSDELPSLLADVATIHIESDGSYLAELGTKAAAEFVTSTVKGRAPGGFAPEINAATATLQVWVKAGAVQQYVITGAAKFSLPFGTKEIRKIASVSIREVAGANLTLPSAALSLLQIPAQP